MKSRQTCRFWIVGLALIAPITACLAQDDHPDQFKQLPSAEATRHSGKRQATTAVQENAAATVHKPATRYSAPASRLIEEIVVTAEKREENIQDVPESVTAFSAGKLEALGVKTVEDLPNITPGLTISQLGGYNLVFLRGIGTDAFLPGADPSVPFYVDGIPLLGSQGSSDTLGHIERVEVLKGPQGTLFGTNSVGGAINIITPEPGNEFKGDVQLGYGNYNAKELNGYVNVPITDHLAATFSAFGNKQKNFYSNTVGPVIGIYSWGGRLKLRWQITDDLTNTFTGAYQQVSDNGGVVWEDTRVAPVLAAVIPQDPSANRVASLDSLGGFRNNSHLLADTLEWKGPLINVKAIGSVQRLNVGFGQADFDLSPLPLVTADSVVQTANQDTAELQFSSNQGTPFSDRLTWVGGLFYIYSSGGFDPISFSVAPNALQVLGGTALGGALTQLLNPLAQLASINLDHGITLYNHGVIASSSLAVYFQGTLKLTDSLNLILGGRFQHTHKDIEGSRTAVPMSGAPGGELVLLTDDLPTLYANQFSPRVGLQWYPFGPGTQIYASWARGYKSPTYNTVNLLGSLTGPIRPVIQEKVNSYELGVKTELFDHTLRLNSALFYTREKDLLTGFAAVLTGGIVSYDTTPAARIRGAEGDALWTPLSELDPGLVLTASASYLDSRYTDYPNGRGYDTTTGVAFGPGFPEPPLPPRNFNGNRIVRTPTLTYNAGVSQTIPLGGGSLELAVGGNYNSGYFFLPQDSDLYATKPYYLLNAHATYIYKPWGTEVTLWGKNLTRTNYDQDVFVLDFGRSEVLNPPRTYGLRVKWSFGA